MYGFQMESGVVAEFGGFSPLKSGGGAEEKEPSIPANAGICTHRFAMQITVALRRRQIPAFAGME